MRPVFFLLHQGRLLCLLGLLGLLLMPSLAQAQVKDDLLRRIGISTKLRVGGSFGMVGETYSASGLANRRQPMSGRIFARVNASGYGLSYGLNLLLSTEQSRFQQALQRQSLNRIDLRLKYRWIETDVGTVSPRLSQYSLSGVTLRGGYVELTPGAWRVTMAGGMERQAVEPVAGITGQPAFRRWLYSGRVGYGQVRGTYLDLIGVYGYDVASSLQEPGSLTPTTNLSMTTVGGVQLFARKLRLEGQLTVSSFDRDTQTAATETSPGFLYDLGIIDPRVGSRMDYAGQLQALINIHPGRLQLQYERIQPGFQSLGVAQIRNDQEVIRVRPQVQLMGNRVRLSGEFSQRSNNLLDDLQSTLRRRQVGFNGQVRFTDALSLTSTYNRLINTNTPVAGSALIRQQQVAQTLTLVPVLTLRRAETTHSLTLVATVQALDDKSDDVQQGLRSGADFDNSTATLSYGLSLPSGFSANASGSLLSSKAAVSDLSTRAVNVGVGQSFFERKVQVNVNGGWASSRLDITLPDGRREDSTRQLTATSTLVYRIPVWGTLSLSVRGLSSRRPASDFREVQTTLRFEHRF